MLYIYWDDAILSQLKTGIKIDNNKQPMKMKKKTKKGKKY